MPYRLGSEEYGEMAMLMPPAPVEACIGGTEGSDGGDWADWADWAATGGRMEANSPQSGGSDITGE